MDDNEVIGGLRLLATDPTPAIGVDVDTVITKARTGTRRRQAVAGAALGTVALIGAFTVLTTTIGHHGSPPAAATSSTAPPVPAAPPVVIVYDARSARLTQELANLRQQLIPAGLTVTTDPDRDLAPGGGPLPALTFATNQGSGTYSADALLTDAAGYGSVAIDVLHNPSVDLSCAGMTAPYYRTCTARQFPDGTNARVTSGEPGIGFPTTGVNNILEAVRPDGTYIRIITSDLPDDAPNHPGVAQPSRPQPPLSTDDLLKFATVFTY